MKKIILALSLCIIATVSNAQQAKAPAKSPAQTIKQDFGSSSIEVTYCRPSVKGRVIFGDLVPYDKVWRTGANTATLIRFKDDVKIAGQNLKAGEYAFFTVPGKTDWEIIFSKDTKSWGASEYKETDDVLRVKVKASTQTTKTEMFTINFANLTATDAEIQLIWDNVLVPILVSNITDGKK
jgi:hypothetical protein